MKIFVAQLITESNTFAPAPTGRGGFEEYGIYRGDASVKAPDSTGDMAHFVRSMLEAAAPLIAAAERERIRKKADDECDEKLYAAISDLFEVPQP